MRFTVFPLIGLPLCSDSLSTFLRLLFRSLNMCTMLPVNVSDVNTYFTLISVTFSCFVKMKRDPMDLFFCLFQPFCLNAFIVCLICASDGFLPIDIYIARICFSVTGGCSLSSFSKCLFVRKNVTTAEIAAPTSVHNTDVQKLFI